LKEKKVVLVFLKKKNKKEKKSVRSSLEWREGAVRQRPPRPLLKRRDAAAAQ